MCSGRQGDLLDWMMEENFSGESQVGGGQGGDTIRYGIGAFWGALFKMGLLKMG